MLPYGRQQITEDDIKAVVEALRSPLLTQGPLVPAFEQKLAALCGARYAVAVTSATAALHLSCLAARLGAGDELVTSSITFVASSNCGLYCGSSVAFTDVDPDTFNMTAATLAKAMTKRTKVVVPVHMTGQSCDMKAIQAEVRKAESKHGKKIFIVEDASHALGGTYRGKPVGSCEYSDMAVLSFHPVKIVTSGEGGAILTNDQGLYELLSTLRSHGITKDPARMTENPGPWYYEQQELGFNYRITDIQCALGLSQLERLEKFVARRQEIAALYDKAFAGLAGVRTPGRLADATGAFHLYVLRIDYEKLGTTRVDVMKRLADQGVGTQVHYIPVYRQPYYRERFKFSPTDYPESERFYDEALSIPMFPAMSDADVKQVIAAISSTLKAR